MTKEIATILGADGFNTTLSEPGRVVVFRRAQGSWEVAREMEFVIDRSSGLRGVRQKMGELLEFLGPCRIFVTGSASGALYYELEKAGCNVWEIAGRPADYLDEVWAEEEQGQIAVQPPDSTARPALCETSPGHFFISIKDIQGKTPDVSSKQILQQFVRQRGFRALEIVCDHIPPWIEMEVAGGGLAIETEPLGKNEIRVRLQNKSAGA